MCGLSILPELSPHDFALKNQSRPSFAHLSIFWSDSKHGVEQIKTIDFIQRKKRKARDVQLFPITPVTQGLAVPLSCFHELVHTEGYGPRARPFMSIALKLLPALCIVYGQLHC